MTVKSSTDAYNFNSSFIISFEDSPPQIYQCENKLHFNEIIVMMSTLYQNSTLSWIFIVQAHWEKKNGPRTDMLLHSDTLPWLSWFRDKQPLLLLLNALAEKQQVAILEVFGLTRPGLEPTINRTHGEHANHYTARSGSLEHINYISIYWNCNNFALILCVFVLAS